MRYSLKKFWVVMVLAVIWGTEAKAQKLLTDTTLTYSQFMQEAAEFKNREKIEEIWVMEFWASFNGRSLSENEQVTKLASKYKNKPIRFVYISADRGRKGWLTQMADRKMTGEHFICGDTARYNALKRVFRHNSIPALFIIDKTGMVRRMKNVQELEMALAEESKALPDHPYGWTPPPVKETPPPPPTEEELLKGWVYHVVKKGESLYSIAKRYNMSITGLQTVNNMENTTEIYIGQKIKIRPDGLSSSME